MRKICHEENAMISRSYIYEMSHLADLGEGKKTSHLQEYRWTDARIARFRSLWRSNKKRREIIKKMGMETYPNKVFWEGVWHFITPDDDRRRWILRWIAWSHYKKPPRKLPDNFDNWTVADLNDFYSEKPLPSGHILTAHKMTREEKFHNS